MNVTVTAAFPPYATAIIALLAAAVSIATQVGNLVVLTAFLVESSLRIPSNYFIASLAVTDVLIGLLSMNLFITYQLLGYWPLGQFLCDVWLSLDFSACLTSQYTVFLITLDRYCSVKIPASYRNWRTLAKVRIMICVSWLFPAGLFTPVIFGWKQMTSEPPRSEGKCDVSFTYYPIFNTTLILCYFWTTLVVMCSLYVGIYRVAKRLQRRNQSAGKKLAALFAMGDQNPEEYEDGEEERERAKSKFSVTKEMKRTNKEKLQLPVSSTQGSWMGNDSGFRDFPSGTDDPVSEAESVKMVTRYRLSGSELNEFSWSDGENHKIFSPLKTSEEQFDLRQVRSPEGVNTEGIIFSESANHTHDTDGTIEENEADIKPPSRIELVDCLSITKYSDSNGRKPSSQLHPERRKVLRDFPEPFYCECDQSAAKQYNPQLTDNYEADSPGSSSPLSLVPVHLFVPSPTVPISGAQGSILQPKTTADPCCNPSVNDSPVWIENHMSKQTPTKKFYYCPECYQIIVPSFVSYDSAQPYRSADEENSCPISPSKMEIFSELSSSGQNESSDRTNDHVFDCYCSYHAHLAQSKAILFTSESSETSSYSDAPIPWYKRTLCPCFWKDKYEPQIHDFHHPCAGTERGFDSNQARRSISNLLRQRKCDVCTNLRQAFAGFSEACVIFHKRSPFSGASASQNATNLGVTYRGVLRKTSSIVSSKRSLNLAKQAARNSLAHFGNSRSLESHNRRHARKALRTISFILGAFIICWTPYHVIMMIKGFCDDLETHTSCVNMHLYNLSYWLCYMNSPINPFCYALSNASFRRTFFRILRCDFQRK